tara:strand:- start:56382 stop:56606 length:225 start_codon:yes stop_codon:yes gene_type:complete
MKLKEMMGVETLGACDNLSDGSYLISYKTIHLNGNLSHKRIDVLSMTNGIGVLGGVFLFDRDAKSPVEEIYKII